MTCQRPFILKAGASLFPALCLFNVADLLQSQCTSQPVYADASTCLFSVTCVDLISSLITPKYTPSTSVQSSVCVNTALRVYQFTYLFTMVVEVITSEMNYIVDYKVSCPTVTYNSHFCNGRCALIF